MAVTPTGSILAQSEVYSPWFSQCIRRCQVFRSLAALEKIFTFWPRRCMLTKKLLILGIFAKNHIVVVSVRANEGQGEPSSIHGALRTSCWITLISAKLTLRSRVSEKTSLRDMEVKNRKWEFASWLLSKSPKCNLSIANMHARCFLYPVGAGAPL